MKKINRVLKIYDALYKHYGPQSWWPGDDWFEVTIGAILTQNTSWKNVEKAIENLKFEGVLSPQKLCDLEENRLSNLIKPAGFYNVKSKRIKNFLNWLKQYDFDLEKIKEKDFLRLRNELLSIKGIGNETADSILLYAFEYPIFVVDAYTKRMFKRLGLVDSDAYEKVQTFFENNLKRDLKLYNEYHALIVKHSKDICKKTPKCDDCFLKEECSYYLEQKNKR